MKLALTIQQRGRRRPMRFEAECSESLTISQMRQLWEVEQILNGLPANLRVHIEISETALGRLDIKKEE